MSRLVESGIITVLFFLVINVVFINIFIFSQQSLPSQAATTDSSEMLNQDICNAECQSNIVDQLAQKNPTSDFQDEVQRTYREPPKEYVIALGTGSTRSKDWEDIGGVEVIINTSNYPSIEHVYFETYLSIPQAQGFAYAKLFNVTDKHDVWFSEVTMEADKIIGKTVEITLDPGIKRYRVMMKSTLGVEAKLHNARLRILTK